MAGEWPLQPINSVALGIFDGPHATPKRRESGPVFLGISSLDRGRIDLAKSDHVTEADFAKWTRRVTPTEGDLVFSYETRIGEAASIPRGLRCCLGRRMGLVRPDPAKMDARFLLYSYLGPEFQEVLRERTVQGSTVERILLTEFPDFPIRVPPIDEQRRIAAVLGALDDKIELNRKMNRTLEELAQALFKSWFIDFDGHDDLVDSEIGPVPRGWVPGVLSDMLILQRGFDLPATTRTEGPYPVFSAGGFHGTHSDFRVVGPGVVTGRSGKLGDVYFVHTDFWPLNTTLWVKEYRRSGPHHAFHLLRMIDFSQFNAGSAVPTLNRNHVHSLPMVVPPAAVIAEFERTVAPLFKRMWLATSESRTLTDLRDTLLPKLISGELRAPEAEVLVEAAG